MSRTEWAVTRDLVAGILHVTYVERPLEFAMQSARHGMTKEELVAKTIAVVLRERMEAAAGKRRPPPESR